MAGKCREYRFDSGEIQGLAYHACRGHEDEFFFYSQSSGCCVRHGPGVFEAARPCTRICIPAIYHNGLAPTRFDPLFVKEHRCCLDLIGGKKACRARRHFRHNNTQVFLFGFFDAGSNGPGDKSWHFKFHQKKTCSYFPQHFLYFLPLPQGQGSLRPTFFCERRTGAFAASSPPCE